MYERNANNRENKVIIKHLQLAGHWPVQSESPQVGRQSVAGGSEAEMFPVFSSAAANILV